MKLRFEHHGDKHAWVELSLDGTRIDRTWGGLDRPASGQRAQKYGSDGEAKLELDRQIARVEQKGYWAGRHEPKLIRAIAVEPDDPAGYLVYGDWLLEREDPRGRLIHAAVQDRDGVLQAHRHQLSPESWDGYSERVWWNGFVRGLTLFGSWFDSGPSMTRMFGHPSMHFVRVVAVENALAASWSSRSNWVREGFLRYWRHAIGQIPAHVARIGVTAGPLLTVAHEVLPGRRIDPIDGPGAKYVADVLDTMT